LLSHTAGLPPHKGYQGTAPGKQLHSIEGSLSGKGLYNEPIEITTKPGSETIYSGSGYTILQLVIENVTGMPFDYYVEEKIMKPLGMKSSLFRQNSQNPNLSKAYGYFEQELPNYQYAEQAAAGLQTNVTDMMKLILASMDVNNQPVKNDKRIKSNFVEEMQKPVLGENGLGVFVRKLSNQQTLVYHSGDNRGWHSLYSFIPETKDGLVILTNSENGIDLRQDVYHAWIEYQTGTLPESYFALTKQRFNNSMISVVTGSALGVYLLLFIIRLRKGSRVFITKHEKKLYIRAGVRTFLLSALGILLFYCSYMWSIINLSAGNVTNLILIIAWIILVLLAGFFSKNRSSIKNDNWISMPRTVISRILSTDRSIR
jgi:hypothetical protein